MPKTGELSKLFEIDRTTVNYYVKTGLLKAGSKKNQYHQYSFADSMALAYIRLYRGLGFTTDEIADLLYEDTLGEKLDRIKVKKKELEFQKKQLRFRQILLENLEASLRFLETSPSGLIPINSDPYYFIRKKDMGDDPNWLNIYRMTPYIEFSARFDETEKRVEIPDMFAYSGISLKESWLEEFEMDPPAGSIYYPGRKKYIAHYFLPGGKEQEELSTRITAVFSDLPKEEKLADEFVFYLYPNRYDTPEEGFDCLCMFDVIT